MGYGAAAVPAANASVDARVEFIRKTYLHLGGAILTFVLLEVILVRSSFAQQLTVTMLGSRLSWVIVMAAFMGVGWLAEKWASSVQSVEMQYVGLGLYVVAEAILFVPILYIASRYAPPNTIATAGLLTGIVFAGLTATVLMTKSDFSWMGQALNIVGLGALGLIIASLIFGFTLGLVFAAAMVVLAAGYILYYTSNVLHHYPVGSHVAAALTLFSAVALLFWYILRILMDRK